MSEVLWGSFWLFKSWILQTPGLDRVCSVSEDLKHFVQLRDNRAEIMFCRKESEDPFFTEKSIQRRCHHTELLLTALSGTQINLILWNHERPFLLAFVVQNVISVIWPRLCIILTVPWRVSMYTLFPLVDTTIMNLTNTFFRRESILCMNQIAAGEQKKHLENARSYLFLLNIAFIF